MRFKAQGQVLPFSRVCCLQIKDMSQHYLHPVAGRGHISHSAGFQTQPAPGYLAWARTDFVRCVHPVTGAAGDEVQLRPPSGEGQNIRLSAC